VVDAGALDGDTLANQACEIRDRPAQLAAEAVEESIHLLLRGLVVHEHSLAPVALEDVAGDVDDADERKSTHIHTADLPAREVVRDDRLAKAVVGIVADPAGAERLAVADLQKAALQLVALAGRSGARLSGGHYHSLVGAYGRS
jgi:hypothetical protein